MNNPQARPIKFSRSLLVIEVTRDTQEPPKWLNCILSIPGHPSTFQTTWSLTHWPLDSRQMEDLTSFLAARVGQAIEMSTGIQTVLEWLP